MKEMMKDAAILFVITLISGLLLGFVYDLTKEPIAAQELSKEQAAYREVFADAAGFNTIYDSASEGGAENAFTFEQIKECIITTGADADVIKVVEATDASGSRVGNIMVVCDHEGYGGDNERAVHEHEVGSRYADSFFAGADMRAFAYGESHRDK